MYRLNKTKIITLVLGVILFTFFLYQYLIKKNHHKFVSYDPLYLRGLSYFNIIHSPTFTTFSSLEDYFKGKENHCTLSGENFQDLKVQIFEISENNEKKYKYFFTYSNFYILQKTDTVLDRVWQEGNMDK